MFKFKKLEKDMSSHELGAFTSNSFKYTSLSESDAIEISRKNQTELVRFGDSIDFNYMKYASMRNGKINPFIGQVHSAFKATTWVKYSDEYKKAIIALKVLADSNPEIEELAEYLLPTIKKEGE